MNLATFLAAAVVSVTFGYQPGENKKSTEYIIQLTQADLRALAQGDRAIYHTIPKEAFPIGSIQIIVGNDVLPKKSLPPEAWGVEHTARAPVTPPATFRGDPNRPLLADGRAGREPLAGRQPAVGAMEPVVERTIGVLRNPFENLTSRVPVPGSLLRIDRDPNDFSPQPTLAIRDWLHRRNRIEAPVLPPRNPQDDFTHDPGRIAPPLDNFPITNPRENNPRENDPRENDPRENDPRENDPNENDPNENLLADNNLGLGVGRPATLGAEVDNPDAGSRTNNAGPGGPLSASNNTEDAAPTSPSENRENLQESDSFGGESSSSKQSLWMVLLSSAVLALLGLVLYQWFIYTHIHRRYLTLLRRTGEV